MSLVTNLTNAFTRVATEAKSLRTLLNGNMADNSALTTSAKSNLVAAINELESQITALSGSAAGIDDAHTATTTTWSSQKTSDSIAQSKADILGGAGAAYDTLQELKNLLDSDDSANQSALNAINAALGMRLRVDINNQGLTAAQQTNGRTNLDTYGTADIGDVTTNFVTTFESGLT